MKNISKKYNCPVSATLELIGGKYKALILWHLTDKTLRFSEIRRLVADATAKMLTQQLRELEEDGLLIRKVYPVVPPKVEYSLTKKGLSLRPILTEMFDWGSKHLKAKGLNANCSMTKNSCGGNCGK
ncbi:DNA-binding HxlR family transcriptional regulator [Elusimicrobium posterum]|uniref:winged helix-turn-helix transcriptional regulator n=1 Tax=Elusimicrobium posterum TaxID=3116653 RepID=UPI003C793678